MDAIDRVENIIIENNSVTEQNHQNQVHKSSPNNSKSNSSQDISQPPGSLILFYHYSSPNRTIFPFRNKLRCYQNFTKLPSNTSTFLSPKSLKAFLKFDPLSVMTATILSLFKPYLLKMLNSISAMRS